MRDTLAVLLHDRRGHREQAEQVDEAVAGRHEHWHVVQAVAVHAPDQRAEDLEARRDDDAHPHLEALLPRRLQRRQVEHDERERAERPLLPERGDSAVGEQQQRRVGQQVGMQPVRLESGDHVVEAGHTQCRADGRADEWLAFGSCRHSLGHGNARWRSSVVSGVSVCRVAIGATTAAGLRFRATRPAAARPERIAPSIVAGKPLST